jgi:peptidoglycan-associated lipoprotein
MQHVRSFTVLSASALLLALAGGCAAPAKSMKSSTELNDGAAVAPVAMTPAAPATAPEPPAPPPAAPCTIARVHFAFDSIALDQGAREELKEAATCLSQKKPTNVLIEGHCDDRGTAAYNLVLGTRRAAAVRSYLADLGVSAPMETISFGKELPAVQAENEAAWKENRRAELRLPGEKRSDGTPIAVR